MRPARFGSPRGLARDESRREARREYMSSRDGEQQILDAVATQLRSENPKLTADFMAFTSITRNTNMPSAEQLNDGRRVASRRRHRHADPPAYVLLIQLCAFFFAGVVLVFACMLGAALVAAAA
jgi:hypothetical protein